MKPARAHIDAFLRAPPPEVRVFLIYGPDAGLVKERAETLASALVPDKNDPFAVSLLPLSALKDSPTRLADEAAMLPPRGQKRLVRIQGATDAAGAALDFFLKDGQQGDGLVLLEAGDLDKRSKLRTACEGSDGQTAAIACYPDDPATRARVIAQSLRDEGIAAAPDVISLLNATLPPDRLAMRSELEKIALYAREAGRVTEADVSALIVDAGEADADALAEAAALGNTSKAMALVDRLEAEHASPVAVLRSLQRHFMRLQRAAGAIAAGASTADAIKKIVPPAIVWKVEKSLTAQLNRWPPRRIEARLSQLADAEAACKRTGAPDMALVATLVLHIAAKN